MSNIIPTAGGPIKVAVPWNTNNIPKAFVSFSSPSKSTRSTEVNET